MVVVGGGWWWVVVGGVQIFYSFSPFLFFLDRALNYRGRFPRGSKKKKSNNDDKHGHGQEKRRPSTLCRGKKKVSKTHKKGNVCQRLGPHNVGKHTFLGKNVYT